MKKIRFGIAGPGNIARKFASAIKIVDEAELVAVAARSRQKGEAFATEFGIPKVFDSYDEMAFSDEIDAVYVATPHPLHKPCAEIFLNAKKHVLCEKPVCVNAREARELYECSKKNGVFLMDSVTALLDNEMFDDEGNIDETAPERVKRDVLAFAYGTGNTVFVSDYIYGDADFYGETVEAYRKGLAAADRALAEVCEEVIEIAYGTEERWK